jgi:hypothetical protein
MPLARQPDHPFGPRSVPRPAFRLLAAALCAALCASCSVIGMQRLEPDLPAGAQPECTSTWTLPLSDMGLAVIAGSASVLLHAAASSRENDGESATSFRVTAWSATGVALGFIASGSYGAYQRSRCRRAEVAYEGAGEPEFLRNSRPLKGAQGAACKSDEDCDDDLLCGEPMKTCIPANEPEEQAPQ